MTLREFLFMEGGVLVGYLSRYLRQCPTERLSDSFEEGAPT